MRSLGQRISRHRRACVILLGLLALAGRAMLLPWMPPPKPGIQDEFSNLLAGQTFSLGRLTNPPHPMWVHFETIHVLSQPTYASKYPPAMGLLFAFGQTVFGDPWIGVLLSSAVLCSSVCWALQGWIAPAWALVGTLLFLLRIGMVSYWTDSYWGGIPAAIGGALLVGALPRLMRIPTIRLSIIFAIGVAILANSRPYEGLALAVPCCLALLWRFTRRVRKGQYSPACLVRTVALPMLAILLPALIWMGYYNYRVTGDPLRLPYQAYEAQYSFWSPFLWSTHPREEPHYNHQAIRDVWEQWDGKRKQFERDHIAAVHLADVLKLDRFFLGVPLTLCMLAGILPMVRSRKWRFAWSILLIFYLGMAMESTLVAHYAAPATALIFLIVTASLRILLSSFPRQWTIRALVIGLFLLLVAEPGVIRLFSPNTRFLFDQRDFIAQRDAVLKTLNEEPGAHLVFVRYGPRHDLNHEWVYNQADIDRSRIVWAHAMGDRRDDELLRYYPNRRAWTLEDDQTITLRPYALYAAGGRP